MPEVKETTQADQKKNVIESRNTLPLALGITPKLLKEAKLSLVKKTNQEHSGQSESQGKVNTVGTIDAEVKQEVNNEQDAGNEQVPVKKLAAAIEQHIIIHEPAHTRLPHSLPQNYRSNQKST